MENKNISDVHQVNIIGDFITLHNLIAVKKPQVEQVGLHLRVKIVLTYQFAKDNVELSGNIRKFLLEEEILRLNAITDRFSPELVIICDSAAKRFVEQVYTPLIDKWTNYRQQQLAR